MSEEKYNYIFWKPQYPLDIFIKQLTENIYKKYQEFYGINIEMEPILEILKFKKFVINHIMINNKEVKVFGSVWEFEFSYLTGEQRKVLQLAVDSGFGEMNSLGFGFMNMVR